MPCWIVGHLLNEGLLTPRERAAPPCVRVILSATLPESFWCRLLGLARSGVCRTPAPASNDDLALMRQID
jgi:hypothetical protein